MYDDDEFGRVVVEAPVWAVSPREGIGFRLGGPDGEGRGLKSARRRMQPEVRVRV